VIRNLRYQNRKVYFGNKELKFPGVEILGMIATGGNGIVLRAQEIPLGRVVALKVWDKAPAYGDLNRALEETRKLADISHPLFVTVHGYFNANGIPYAILEFVQGSTAREWLINSEQSLENRYALWGMYIQGLRVLHEKGTLHGDPHAKNILVFADAQNIYREICNTVGSDSFGVKLTDLGTSLLMGRAPTKKREAEIILEVGREIWAPAKPDEVIDLTASSKLRFVISALESYAAYRWSIAELARGLDNVYFVHRAAIRLAEELAAVPVYDLHKIVENVQEYSEKASGYLLSHLLAYTSKEIENRSSDRNRYVSNYTVLEDTTIKIQDVEEGYQEWRDLYLTKELYDVERPPMLPVYRRGS